VSFYPREAGNNFDFTKPLLEREVPRLGVSMGKNYMNIVRKCLEGSFEGVSGFNEGEYDSMAYKESVRQGLL